MFLLLFLLKLENTENKKQHLVCEIKKKMIYVYHLSMIHLANKNCLTFLIRKLILIIMGNSYNFVFVFRCTAVPLEYKG